MEHPILLAAGFLTIATLIAIPLSRLISRGLLGSWRQLVEAYPEKEIQWKKRRRFTSAMFTDGRLPLRFNNMLQLSSAPGYLGLGTSPFGSPEVVISKTDVEMYSDQTALLSG